MIKIKPQDLNDTTRCYPRTLHEAFPNHPENATWIEPPEWHHSYADKVVTVASAIALVVFGGIMLVWG